MDYFMPAEFSPHLGCLIIYPHNRSVWRGNCEPARKAFRDVARAISSCGEPVTIFCQDEETARKLTETLAKEKQCSPGAAAIFVHVLCSDDSWCRDTGPTFVVRKDNQLAGVDWMFNAYGGKEHGCYWPCERDRLVTRRAVDIMAVALKMKIECLTVHDIVLEGGGIHVDGEGTVIATEETLLNINRNPNLTKEEVESKVLEQLGAQKMIWIPRGLYMDEDTNGHIDNLACFVAPGHIALAWSDDKKDPQHDISTEALRILENTTDARGRQIKVTKLHVPPPLYYTKEDIDSLCVDGDSVKRYEGERLAASYVNFYIANTGVIVPGFGHPESDAKAVRTLQSLFPGRRIVQIYSREILLGGGNIHCITQQVPDPCGA